MARLARVSRVARVARVAGVCDGGDFSGGQREVMEAQRVLVGELAAARNELVESRWRVVAVRIEAGMAKSDGIDFGGGQREVAEA